ncbi:hypothetical protein WN944_010315 [Citrus x changshan-huyou]|uniref:Uncharacterized protein n=1 Tax=Citrus x changshan-huyou TaxID=2935761 RepID=A0AAP0MUN3_9ROSI
MGGRRRPPTGEDQWRPEYATVIGVCKRDERPVEMDWFDLADENEFALPNLNDEVHIEQMTAIKDSLEMMAANDDGDVFADECTDYNIENDLPYADSEERLMKLLAVRLMMG